MHNLLWLISTVLLIPQVNFNAFFAVFRHYNFCHIHQTLKVSPAMAAGITDKLYDLEFIVNLIDNKEKSSKK